ncbi:L-serine ammonia-lyase [Aquisalimonas asiatica]|uniref:L-serine dehydratase n=1 Tax=Aquisalimonas asiatica TaxID=406100 RepID=A0A1H8QWI4_9GAMM|nr:L-serine ammonia-lyase [Aquisalimonas asiatica]SEO58649.1 L-serine ammonia-lyase [Aquisalimonas asiatica]
MTLSVFDFFRIGIGPSSSHTVGPMRAAGLFVSALAADGTLDRVDRARAELFGSLGATGRGHGSGPAVLLGLEGADPETVDPDRLPRRSAAIIDEGELILGNSHRVAFDANRDLLFHGRKSLPEHPNGLRFTAWDDAGTTLTKRDYYSVGGGFLRRPDGGDEGSDGDRELPCPFTTAQSLLDWCEQRSCRISDVTLANEQVLHTEADIRAGLDRVRRVMEACVARGFEQEGELPGPFKVRRRAPGLYRRLTGDGMPDPLEAMDWLAAYAIAVNEENACGGRVVTAPTNGAAGIVPAVMHYYLRHTPRPSDDGVARYLLTAAAIGMIIKRGASISGAEAGCQGEVGSACAMAAAGLTEVLGGTPAQVENAAEIAVEHHLGMTCDPVGGLVQIPCIERNAMGSVKAVNACRLALSGDGTHVVSLDKAVKTMRDTGRDMKSKYKETSRGGLAVNIVEC